MINKINFTSSNIYASRSIMGQMKNDELSQIQEYADKMDTDIFILEKTSATSKEYPYSSPAIVYKTVFSKGGQVWQKDFNTGRYTKKCSVLKDNEGVSIYKDKDSRLTNTDSNVCKNINEIFFVDDIALDEASNPITGTVISKTHEGKTAKMTYLNGLLIKNELYDSDDSLIHKQIYNYDSEGKMNIVFKVHSDGNWQATRKLNTGEVLLYKNSQKPYRIIEPKLGIITDLDSNLTPTIKVSK